MPSRGVNTTRGLVHMRPANIEADNIRLRSMPAKLAVLSITTGFTAEPST